MKEDTLQKTMMMKEETLQKNKGHSHKKKGNKRRHHVHAPKDDEPSKKRSRYESEDSLSEDEYVLISALTGNITHGSDDWLIDSGASKHMTGFKESFVRLSEHESPHKVKLGDDYQYWGIFIQARLR